MRLNQYLAACGFGSRRECEALIAAGRVRVNGDPGHFGMRVASGDLVTLDGKPLRLTRTQAVWMYHKPAGVLCSAHDPRGRPTVVERVRAAGVAVRVFTVGRLDFDTTGLLLLTDDGDLAFALTHPSHAVDKEYEARIDAPLADAALAALRRGIELDDGPTQPCDVRQERDGDRVLVRLVLREGRKRQVRRMLAAVGAPVVALHRVRVGPLRLGALPVGALRGLEPDEEAALRAAAGGVERRGE